MIESSKKVKPWRQDVKAAAEAWIVLWQRAHARPWSPLDGPLLVRMVFTLPKPMSAPKRRRTWPDKKPDLSKLIRSPEDAPTDAGMIRDAIARASGRERGCKYVRTWGAAGPI